MVLLTVLYMASIFMWLYIFYAKPYLILRPAFAYSGYMIVFLNFTAAFFNTETIINSLPGRNYTGGEWEQEVRLLSILSPIFIMAWIWLSPRLSRLTGLFYHEGIQLAAGKNSNAAIKPYIVIALFFSFIILAMYLYAVPLSETGLWAMFFDQENYPTARENSLKLLSSRVTVYAFSFFKTALIPLAGAMLGLLNPRSVRMKFGRLFCLVVLMLLVTLPGARFPVFYVLLSFFMSVILKKGEIRRNLFVTLPLLGIFCFALLLAISMLRSGSDINMINIAALVHGLGNRVFAIPFGTGLCTIDYTANVIEPAGIAGIRPLAWLAGIPNVEMTNNVYDHYYLHSFRVESGSMVTCFLYENQALFGFVPGWVLSLFQIFVLDAFLYFLRPIHSKSRLAYMIVFSICLLALISSGYFVSLFTHGIILVPIFGFCSSLIVSLLRRYTCTL